MNIFVTIEGEKHEGESITGLFFNYEDAIGSIGKENIPPTDMCKTVWTWERKNGTSYSQIEEHTVMGNVKEFYEASLAAEDLAKQMAEQKKIRDLADLLNITEQKSREIINENS